MDFKEPQEDIGFVKPILFIFGSSGVGKSTLGKLLVDDLNFMHVNFDPEVVKGKGFEDGPKNEGLQVEWNILYQQCNTRPLAAKIRERITSSGLNGACVTLSSLYDPEFIRLRFLKLKPENIFYIVLFGSAEECYKGFSERDDGLSVQQKNKESWTTTNSRWHDVSKFDDLKENIIHVFDGYDRRPHQQMIADVRKVLGK